MNIIITLILAPLFPGIINKVKAFFAGRKGPPLLQLYFDLFKLIRKKEIYSKTTSIIFRINPIVSLLSLITIVLFLPFGGKDSLFSFSGDIIFIAYLLGLARLFMVIAALDTGSSFEGMGASREVSFAAFVEPTFFLALASLAKKTDSLSLSSIYTKLTNLDLALLILIMTLFFILLIVENCRIPIDDPNTHLELTMIHEVMILDYSSKDLALLFYSASLKLWIYGTLLISLFLKSAWLYLPCMAALALLVGIIESIMARLKIAQVFTLLLIAFSIGCFAFLLVKD